MDLGMGAQCGEGAETLPVRQVDREGGRVPSEGIPTGKLLNTTQLTPGIPKGIH